MPGNHHPKTPHPSDTDLESNSGVGQSLGLDDARDAFEDEEGENTAEGDVLNDTTRAGGVNPKQRGRTNK